MIAGLTALLVCQLIGEAVARGFGLPVPGPVLGLLLLVGGLALRERMRPGRAEDRIAPVADGLLASLGLLFVPAGVGVLQQGEVLARDGLALGLALVGSTLATLLCAVGTFLLVKRLTGRRET